MAAALAARPGGGALDSRARGAGGSAEGTIEGLAALVRPAPASSRRARAYAAVHAIPRPEQGLGAPTHAAAFKPPAVLSVVGHPQQLARRRRGGLGRRGEQRDGESNQRREQWQ